MHSSLHPIEEEISVKLIKSTAMVVSTEMIKPSAETPPHLRYHQFSLLDQMAPPYYFHIIFYFSPSDHLTTVGSGLTSKTLKRSLSDALAVYYPLAGRLREDHTVECNDAGVEYLEKTFYDERISGTMNKIEERTRYVPVAPWGGRDIPLAIQVSFFGCSGVAIGVCVWHKLADAKSTLNFVDKWASACLGDLKISAAFSPTFEMASRFPPIEHPWVFPDPDKNVVTTRVMFDAARIEKLKTEASGLNLEKPTSVEAVSAFIWRRLIEGARKKDSIGGGGAVDRLFAAVHVVDVRGRASHPLPSHSFGNGMVNVMAVTDGEGGDYHSLALKLREEFRKVDGDYVGKFEDGSMFAVKEEKINDDVAAEERKVVDVCVFSSWVRLPAFGVDFGWGKPAAVATLVAAPLKNMIVLMGTRSGDGIEAWINFVADDIAFMDFGL